MILSRPPVPLLDDLFEGRTFTEELPCFIETDQTPVGPVGKLQVHGDGIDHLKGDNLEERLLRQEVFKFQDNEIVVGNIEGASAVEKPAESAATAKVGHVEGKPRRRLPDLASRGRIVVEVGQIFMDRVDAGVRSFKPC